MKKTLVVLTILGLVFVYADKKNFLNLNNVNNERSRYKRSDEQPLMKIQKRGNGRQTTNCTLPCSYGNAFTLKSKMLNCIQRITTSEPKHPRPVGLCIKCILTLKCRINIGGRNIFSG